MQKEKILITVKTYPTLSSTYGELACTAGIREDGHWVRIYPIPYRRLKSDYRYEKYTWVEFPLEKNQKDNRPESYRPVDLSQIKPLGKIGTSDKWLERKRLIFDKMICFTDMSELIRRAKSNELSLALFKPSLIEDFVCEETEREWDRKKINAVLADLRQGLLFPREEFLDDFKIVKKLPYKFSYIFRDSNNRRSKLMIEDWEAGALYWNCVKQYNCEQKAIEKVKEKFFTTFVARHDLYFYIGTTLEWHFRDVANPFVIVGLFAPPIENQCYMNFQ